MPCSPEKDYYDYPDYLKKIIKEIEADKDEQLKACLCYLRTPLTEEFCIVKDEDKKVVAFPFCLREDDPNFDPNDGVIANLALTYKQAMELFWKPIKDKTVKLDIDAKGDCTCQNGESGSVAGKNNLKSDKRTIKEVFCYQKPVGAEISSEDDPRVTLRTDSGCSYGDSDYYLGLGIGLFVHKEGFHGWIDTDAKKIYPYIGVGVNLGGCKCAPNLIPTSATITGSKITITLASYNPPFECAIGTSSGTVKIDLP